MVNFFRSALFSLCAVSIILLLTCNNRNSSNPPKAIAGILDLSHWDFERDGIVNLSGDYEFYWMKFVEPSSFSDQAPEQNRCYMRVPGLWNNKLYLGERLPGHGYATYRLQILLNEPHQFAFKFLTMATAFRVFANGEEILNVGTVGKSQKQSVPEYYPQVVDYLPRSYKVDLVVWVSNFHHRKGGAWDVLKIGLENDIRNARDKRLFLDFFLFSSIFIMGLYHIALFILRRKDKPSIYFGLFAILIALRFMTQREIYLVHLFPFIEWQSLVKIEYLSYYLALPIFALFFYFAFRQDFYKGFLYVIHGICALFSLIVIFTTVNLFSYTVPFFHTFTIFCCFYGMYLLVICIKRKREGAQIILFGFVALSITIFNDILENFHIVQTPQILPFGLIVFIFSLTVLIAHRFTRAFQIIEWQHKKISETSEKYRTEIVEHKKAEMEKQELQEKLQRTQKMEALGLLAGGVAHDLNNILAGLVTYPDLLLWELPADSPLREHIEVIKSSGERAGAVVQDLLSLAGRTVLQFYPINLNDVIMEYLHSPEHEKCEKSFPAIVFNTFLEPKLMNMKGSPVHLKKVIMNLIYNAADAQPNGGIINVITKNIDVENIIKGYENITPGQYVFVQIKDFGSGIDALDMKKIFEPFYTKKVMGRTGTGLGMTVVWGTVHDHHGYIDVKSEPGKGTTFDLYFPVTSEISQTERSKISFDELKGKNESILVVDDAVEQRQVATKILSVLGYNVASVASGEQAIEHIKNYSVQLVVLDMIMDNGINGLETFLRIKEINPEIKAIIASGFSESDEVKQAQQHGAGIYLKKPYTMERLGLAVKQELSRV